MLARYGADLTAKKKDGMTVLHMAASTNDVHLMDFILQNVESKKELVNTRNGEGWTALHFSSFLNNFDSTNLLLENGADLLDKNGQEMTTIDELIRNDHKDLLSCVYERVKAKVARRDLTKQGSFSYVHLAAGQPNSQCLQYLIEVENETPNEICNVHDNSYPLHFAVLAKNHHNCKVLLKNGASPNVRDAVGNTPMHLAVGLRNLSLVRLLDDYFADAEI